VTHAHLTASYTMSRDQMGRCDWLQVAMKPEVMSWDCHILSTRPLNRGLRNNQQQIAE